MNTNIIVAIVVLLLGGGAWFLFTQDNKNVETNSEDRSTEMPASEQVDNSGSQNLSGTGSFARFLGLGKALRCDFSSDTEGYASSGVFYTDGENFKVDSTTMTPDGDYTTKIINDGEYQYIWGGGAQGEMAIKMSIVTLEANKVGTDSVGDEAFDIEEEVDYECHPWTADKAQFIPPADIQFIDIEVMMQGQLQGLPIGF